MPVTRFVAVPAWPLLAACLFWPAADAAAQQGPQRIGEFQAWTAATHAEGGQKVCYAFTRATRSEGVPNRAANNVLLVVTHRPKGRDQVALQSGYAYPRSAGGDGDPVKVSVGGTNLGFYTSGNSAFARDNKAAIAALKGGREAVARGPLPNGGRGQATDAFSLAGFGAALDAISRECPASAPAQGASRR
ncbi:invasion associated locus B family protein [Craurococcus roseus]|uniref:Invasion associated locus B family protein n=1 Tax=Craurococcus roseus TaxID=77585 RepID=A0ABP3QRT9_9PROT